MSNMAIYDRSETESLIERVQSLPPELYNKIHDLSFTVDLDSMLTPEHLDPYHEPAFRPTFHIDETWRPPALIQVSRNLRERLSPAFYEGAIFVFKDDLADPDNLSLLTRWLKSLSPKRQNMVSRSQFCIVTTSEIQFRPNNMLYRVRFRDILDPIYVDIVVDLTRRVYRAMNATGGPFAKMRNVRFRIPMEGKPGQVWDAHANRKLQKLFCGQDID